MFMWEKIENDGFPPYQTGKASAVLTQAGVALVTLKQDAALSIHIFRYL